jgi:hypothetical protein
MGQTHCLPSRGSSKVAPFSPLGTIIALWDTENLSGPLKRCSLGDLSAALARCCFEAAGGVLDGAGGDATRAAPVEVIAVHGERFPRNLKSSLRVRGATLLDAGPKRGSVDGALKGYWNDIVVDALLREGGKRERGWLFCASGDKDFSDDVRRAQRAGWKVGIIFGDNTSSDFFSLGDARVPWKTVVAAAEGIAADLLRRGVVEAVADGGAAPPAPSPAPASPAPPAAPSARQKSSVPCRDFQRDACFRANCRFAHVKSAAADGAGAPPAKTAAADDAGGAPHAGVSPAALAAETAAFTTMGAKEGGLHARLVHAAHAHMFEEALGDAPAASIEGPTGSGHPPETT